jgi:glucose-6-phosphate isomerase
LKQRVVENQEERLRLFPAGYQKEIVKDERRARSEKISARIWAKDFRVWGADPAEIANRLGWLDSPAASAAQADGIIDFVSAVREDGYTNVLLLGMGGSSLAAEVFSCSFGARAGYLELEILDSTHPGAVLEKARRLDPENTLYIVATKSGGTVETFSFMKYFYNQTLARTGREKAGRHFIAITDPGSGLETAARQLNFRKIFLNDPDIGGRYAALSFFGIVPAALLGIDIKELLKRAAGMAGAGTSSSCLAPGDSSWTQLGVAMGRLAVSGRDKLSFIASDRLVPFANWLEQLIAESTGKGSKGILPVVGEAVMPPGMYAADRFFVYLHLPDDHVQDQAVRDLRAAGHPVADIVFRDAYDIGAEFFRWEMATAIACWRMGVQPFNQPDVEAAKVLSREMLAEYSRQGKLPQPRPQFEFSGIKVYVESDGAGFNDYPTAFFGKDAADFRDRGNGYISIQAYVQPDPNARQALQRLRAVLQRRYLAAVTVGYGPRFLHSTGQLHKGDAGKGVFVQVLSRMEPDAPIPDQAGSEKSGISFGTLITAQAFGDRQALLEKNRRVITFQFTTDQDTGFAALARLLAKE